jgi:ribosomal-protein-alanine N-acetyltransferase
MIRPARPADEARLRAIQSAALEEPWPDLLGASLEGVSTVFVADTDAGPVGYALVVPDRPTAYLAELAVAPPAQGQGHGSRLLALVVERFRDRGFDELRLTARADDERVRSFYDGFGFTVAEELPDHYEDGDGVLLVRGL